MYINAVVFLISLLLVHSQSLLTPSSVTNDCIVTFESINTTFDLCHLRINIGGGWMLYYRLEDSRNSNNEVANTNHYEYYFNIGAPVRIMHPICDNMTQATDNIYGYCPDESNCTAATQLTPIEDPAWVYQVWFNKSTGVPFRCYRLSNEFGGPPVWSLYNDGNPSLGVQVTYLNGDHVGCQGNRKFNIRFLCANVYVIPDYYPLYEYSECEFTVELPSIYGCPVQCAEYDNEICAGNGLCGFDFTQNALHCFCYHQWMGDDCSIYNPSAVIPNDSVKVPPDPQSPFVKEFHINETDIDVVYDLSEYAVVNNIYIVNDLDYSRNYTYYVGVPNPVLPQSMGGTVLPIQCENIVQPCSNIGSASGECMSGIEFGSNYAYVFQLNTDTNECVNLGTRVRWELYDADNAAAGVTGVYYDGSWCQSGGRNMEIRLHFVCPTDQDSVYHPRNETKIDLYEYVARDDDTGCSYSFVHFSAIACPYQCVAETLHDNIETFTVCAQRGYCVADPYAGFVRCLCDDGWTGIDCQQIATNDPTQQPSENPSYPTTQPTENPTVGPTESPNVISIASTSNEENAANDKKLSGWLSKGYVLPIIIVGIVVVFLVIGIGYFIYKNRKQKTQLQKINSSDEMCENDDVNLLQTKEERTDDYEGTP